MSTRHRARKRFGQNFLVDENVVEGIAAAIDPRPGEHLVEIGPGQGALTGALLEGGCRLDAVELDRDLAPVLEQRFGGEPQFAVHRADALRFDFASLAAPGERLRLVGNLPYNISTPLIFHLLDFAAVIEDMHFMLQREVVERMTAQPGSKAWGKLGVMVQYHCEVETVFEVPPEAFSPRPKVDSAIVRLRPRPGGPLDREVEQRLRRLVSAAFSQRRKTLRNTLRDLIDMQQLEQAGISPAARAETLSLEQFLALSERLKDHFD